MWGVPFDFVSAERLDIAQRTAAPSAQVTSLWPPGPARDFIRLIDSIHSIDSTMVKRQRPCLLDVPARSNRKNTDANSASDTRPAHGPPRKLHHGDG